MTLAVGRHLLPWATTGGSACPEEHGQDGQTQEEGEGEGEGTCHAACSWRAASEHLLNRVRLVNIYPVAHSSPLLRPSHLCTSLDRVVRRGGGGCGTEAATGGRAEGVGICATGHIGGSAIGRREGSAIGGVGGCVRAIGREAIGREGTSGEQAHCPPHSLPSLHLQQLHPPL